MRVNQQTTLPHDHEASSSDRVPNDFLPVPVSNRNLPGAWPDSPEIAARFQIPPTAVFSLSGQLIRDQVSLMSGAVVNAPPRTSPGMVVPLPDAGLGIPEANHVVIPCPAVFDVCETI